MSLRGDTWRALGSIPLFRATQKQISWHRVMQGWLHHPESIYNSLTRSLLPCPNARRRALLQHPPSCRKPAVVQSIPPAPLGQLVRSAALCAKLGPIDKVLPKLVVRKGLLKMLLCRIDPLPELAEELPKANCFCTRCCGKLHSPPEQPIPRLWKPR